MSILGLSPRDAERLRRLLADYEAGALTRSPSRQTRRILETGTRKPLVRFSLAAALTVDDASKTATIRQQYGPGAEHTATGAGAITVLNPSVVTTGKRQYHGASGVYGWGIWHQGTEFAIIDLECP